MKRTFSFGVVLLVVGGTALVAATYGLVRLAYGLYLPDVRAELGLSVAAAGVVSGLSSLVYCAAAVVGLLAADRRPRTLVVATAVTAGVGAAAMATAPTAPTFAVAAVAASAGAGLASPTMVAVLEARPGTRGSASAQAVVNSGTGPGLVGAGLLAVWLLPDWRTAWAWSAVVVVASGALVVGCSRTSPRPAPTTRGSLPRAWWAAHRDVAVASLLLGCGSAAVWSYGRTVLLDEGATTTTSVLAWVAVGAGGAVAAVSGRLEGRLGPRGAWQVTVGVVAVSVALLPVSASAGPWALVLCTLFGWAFVAATSALIAWTLAVDADRAASGTALLFVVLVLGQAIGSTATGTGLGALGSGATFAAAGAVAACGAVVVRSGVRPLRDAGEATRGRPRAGRARSRRSA